MNNMHAKYQYLKCPIDDLPLEVSGSSLTCSNNHCYDISKKGQVNLLPVQFKKSKNPGDSKEMVIARRDFLNSGNYSRIADILQRIIARYTDLLDAPFIVDAGCGEGYYLNTVAERLQDSTASFLGFDISKDAVAAAASRNKKITWIVASNKNLPIQDNSIDILISQFGFPVYSEFKRVLKPNGKIVLVDTAENHLLELRNIIYSEVRTSKAPSIDSSFEYGFKLCDSERLSYKTKLNSQQEISNLLSMTPHLFRAKKEGKEAVKKIFEIEVTVDVTFRILERR